MFEFRWSLPSPTESHEIRLRIRARNGWIGRKVLLLDARPIYRRRWFGGIDHSFAHPDEPGTTLELRAVRDPQSKTWAPALYCDGTLLPETTHNDPPPVPDRPKVVSVVVGVAYLAIFMMVVMLQHIPRMLNAVRGHNDIRNYVLELVAHREEADLDGLRLHRAQPPPAKLHEPYAVRITAQGGTPPYRWERIEGRMPPGLTLDQTTGTIRGTPTQPGDLAIRLRVTDAVSAQAAWPYVLTVQAPRPGYPRIVAQTLPPAEVGQAYAAQLRVADGQPPYHWVVNTRKLPKGLEFAVAPQAGESQGTRVQVAGTPAPETAGAYALQFRVTDAAYSPYQDIWPWSLPFAATAICLLGFWTMRRWSVPVYGGLILVQVLLGLAVGGYPFSITAVILQVLVWGVGAVHWPRMH